MKISAQSNWREKLVARGTQVDVLEKIINLEHVK